MMTKDLALVFVIIYVVGTVHCDNQPLCDDGWFHFNNTCYLINNIKSISRSAAEAECSYYDAGLLQIDTTEQLDYLVDLMKMHPSSGFWTNLNDISRIGLQKEGTGFWKWGQFEIAEMDMIQWNQSPTNDGQSNCAGLNIQGKMEDRDCNSMQHFICKAKLPEGCPLGWLVTGEDTCYWFNEYKVKTWEQAKEFCADNSNSQLLILGQKDLEFIKSELPFLPKTSHVFWTGLYSSISGDWGWYTQDYFDPSLVQWQAEPNNLAGIESCGVLRTTGKFSDRNCSSDANFICNKPKYSYDRNIDTGCGPWKRAGRSCYGFITGKNEGTWLEARQYCQSMGADLIKVDSFAKKLWLETQLMVPANDRLFWTGLNYRKIEATYVWADGSPINTTYVKWNQEPNNYKGNEDCALITSIGSYNDVPCITKAAAICEIDDFMKDPCQAGWIRYQKNCYTFTPFYNSSLLYNQIEADAYCQAAGGRLLSVNDHGEKAFILSQIKHQFLDNVYGYWTSLNDKKAEGVWSFGNENGLATGLTLVDWAGEPSTYNYDDCGLVSFAGHYHMRNCNTRISFICEKVATGSKNDSNQSNPGNESNSTN